MRSGISLSLDIRNFTEEQKVILYTLGLLERNNRMLDLTSLQKILFLVTKNFPEMLYIYNEDYEPFDFGPYSELLERDVARLQDLNVVDKNLIVKEENKGLLIEYEKTNRKESANIAEFLDGFMDLSRDDLLYVVYKLYPEYTTKSRIAKKIRSEKYDSYNIDFDELKIKGSMTIVTEKGTMIMVKLIDDRIVITTLIDGDL